MRTGHLTLASILLLTTAALGCGGGEQSPPEPPPPQRVESQELGLAIAAVPDGFELVANEGATLRFERSAGLPPGQAWIELGPPVEGGINLVEVVRGQREAFEALPQGSFSGNGELQLPDGRPAYYSRGRFEDSGAQVEEFRIWAVHPVEKNRLLQIYYRYPAGEDSRERLDDVLYLLGEIEGLEPAAGEAAGDP